MAGKGLRKARKLLVFLLALSLLFSNMGFDGFVYADGVTKVSADTTRNEDETTKEEVEKEFETTEEISATEEILTSEESESSSENKESETESQTSYEETGLTTQAEMMTSSSEADSGVPQPSKEQESTSKGNAANDIKNPVSRIPEWWTEKFGEMDADQVVFQTNVEVSLTDENKESIGLDENNIKLVPYISLEGDKYDLVPAEGSHFSVKQDSTISFMLTPGDFLDSEVIYIGIKAEYPSDSNWYHSDNQDEFLFKASVTGSREGSEYPIEVIEELELKNWNYKQSGNDFSVTRALTSSAPVTSGWWDHMFSSMRQDGTVLMYTVTIEPKGEDGGLIKDAIDVTPYYGTAYNNMNIVSDPDKVKITANADGTIQLVFNIQAGDYSDENHSVYLGVKAGSDKDGEWHIPDNQDDYILTAKIEPVNPMHFRGNNFQIELNEGISPNNELRKQKSTECTVSQVFVQTKKVYNIVEVVKSAPIRIKMENGNTFEVYCYNSNKKNPEPGERYIEFELGDEISELQDPVKFEELNEALRRALFAGYPINGWGIFETMDFGAYHQTQQVLWNILYEFKVSNNDKYRPLTGEAKLIYDYAMDVDSGSLDEQLSKVDEVVVKGTAVFSEKSEDGKYYSTEIAIEGSGTYTLVNLPKSMYIENISGNQVNGGITFRLVSEKEPNTDILSKLIIHSDSLSVPENIRFYKPLTEVNGHPDQKGYQNLVGFDQNDIYGIGTLSIRYDKKEEPTTTVQPTTPTPTTSESATTVQPTTPTPTTESATTETQTGEQPTTTRRPEPETTTPEPETDPVEEPTTSTVEQPTTTQTIEPTTAETLPEPSTPAPTVPADDDDDDDDDEDVVIIVPRPSNPGNDTPVLIVEDEPIPLTVSPVIKNDALPSVPSALELLEVPDEIIPLSNAPKTGDSTNMKWFMMFFGSSAVLGAVIWIEYKRKKKA